MTEFIKDVVLVTGYKADKLTKSAIWTHWSWSFTSLCALWAGGLLTSVWDECNLGVRLSAAIMGSIIYLPLDLHS